MQERILIVDDDPLVLEVLDAVLTREGFEVTQATSGADALQRLGERAHGLALCDIRMPGMDGFELLEEIRRLHPNVDVVLTTGYGSLEGAVDAMALGAADYLTKPLKPKEIVARLRSIQRRRELEAEVHELHRELHLRHDIRNVVAESPKMRAVVTAIQRVGLNDQPVVLRGQPGTGRRFLARAIHYSSERKQGPFEAIDCASPPREGVEALLLGRRDGGRRPRRGLLERKASGSVHLHRLEHCSEDLQRKLAAVIDSRSIQTGPDSRVPLEARLILSFGDDLDGLLDGGRIVPELETLRKFTAIHLPPLSERAQDLPGLVSAFCDQYAIDQGTTISVSPEAMSSLAEKHFARNAREFFAFLRHAATLSLDGVISRETIERASIRPETSDKRPIADALGDREHQIVLRAVQRNPGRLDEAARELGVSRTTLWRRMRKYDIKV